jgi:hypothetical protein
MTILPTRGWYCAARPSAYFLLNINMHKLSKHGLYDRVWDVETKDSEVPDFPVPAASCPGVDVLAAQATTDGPG